MPVERYLLIPALVLEFACFLLYSFPYCSERYMQVVMGWGIMGFNITFNNSSVISWRSVLFMEETGENHCSVASH
jgi:hypothetical protein